MPQKSIYMGIEINQKSFRKSVYERKKRSPVDGVKICQVLGVAGGYPGEVLPVVTAHRNLHRIIGAPVLPSLGAVGARRPRQLGGMYVAVVCSIGVGQVHIKEVP